MKIAMKVKKLTRRHICSVNKCRNRDTFLVHRGDDVNHQPLYLCEGCIKEIVHGYIDVEGVEHAREVLGSIVERLTAGEKPHIPAGEASENVGEVTENVGEVTETVTESPKEVKKGKSRTKKGE